MMDCFALQARNDRHCEERSDVAIHFINNMTLELRQISLRYSKKTVLDNLCITFKERQLHALLGENGAGKSTTANIICGELLPHSGTILIDDKPVIFRTPRDAIQNGISYVHQRPMLADYITVKENLLLGLNKEQKKQLIPQAERWLPDVNLNSFVKNYGADTRFFIALTSALIKSPRLLILDEPSALLDDNQRKFLFENLRALAQDGMNIIIITHNFEEAQKYCDTVDFIEDGRIVEKSELEEKRPFESLRDRNIDSKGHNKNPIILTYNNTAFEIQKGKITLIKGLAEDGLDELEKNLLTLRRHPNKKIGFIPTDRKFTGSNPNLTIEQMLTSALDISENTKLETAKKMITASGVNIEPQEKCSCLSGGMLQKLMLEREFYDNPDFLILCNPLQGLDIQTSERTCKRIMDAANNGSYVLVLSYGAYPLEYSNIKYRLSNGHLEAM